jgi:ankyrin repeat protein
MRRFFPNAVRRLTALAAGLGLLILAAAAGLLASCATAGPSERAASLPAVRSVAGAAGRLFAAAEKGDLAAVRRMVEENPALLGAEDPLGWNALSYAAWAGRMAVYRYLRDRGGNASLFAEAALGRFPDLVERLKARPAAVRDRDLRERATPLAWAARTGNLEACLYLLSLGAEVDAADRSGDRPLHAAVRRGDAELARELLRAGAAPGAAGAGGATALHLAGAGGSFQLVELLLDAGAPVAAADGEGNTPLHAAAAAGRLEVCQYLLLRGASRSAKNRRGLTAADLAAAAGYSRLAELLKERS